MRPLGTWFVEPGTQIPTGSRTGALYDRLVVGTAEDYVEGSVASHVWFEWPKRERLWEEAMLLGGHVLTYLAMTED